MPASCPLVEKKRIVGKVGCLPFIIGGTIWRLTELGYTFGFNFFLYFFLKKNYSEE